MPDEPQQQLADPLGLFLLHPMPGAVDQVTPYHTRARALLHPFKIARTLIGSPVAFPGYEEGRHLDGTARK